MASVNIFNASPEEIVLEINGGDPLHVAATGDTSNWMPQPPDQAVQWSERQPMPGQFHYGENKIRMYRSGQDRTRAQEPAIQITMAGEQVNSLQFYLFWHTGQDLAWIMLRDGRPIAVSETMAGAFLGV